MASENDFLCMLSRKAFVDHKSVVSDVTVVGLGREYVVGECTCRCNCK